MWGVQIQLTEVMKKINEIETVSTYFIGTINEINGNIAIVYSKLGGLEGDVFVDLSVNNDATFQIGDKINVEYDGTILESNPAQINTLSVELIEN
ncbi:DUF3221 domain-containing protein [Oceanobacillus sp. 1P07AA]|uniref:DUF3221 domain-containing protein n=1 Tax=Oceanobacillus sp. 1P07AA TaxID=3132293 RepID=UPI0039A61A09